MILPFGKQHQCLGSEQSYCTINPSVRLFNLCIDLYRQYNNVSLPEQGGGGGGAVRTLSFLATNLLD